MNRPLIGEFLPIFPLLSIGLLSCGLLGIINPDILTLPLIYRDQGHNYAPASFKFSLIDKSMLAPINRSAVFLTFLMLISAISSCGPGEASVKMDQRQLCEMVRCVERKIEYVWDSGRSSYQPSDVGCKTYDINPDCVYGKNSRKARAHGKAGAKDAVVFTEVSCVRKLIDKTQYTVTEAQVLCRQSIQKIEKKSDAWIKKDACIDRSIRAGRTVLGAIQNCYWGAH